MENQKLGQLLPVAANLMQLSAQYLTEKKCSEVSVYSGDPATKEQVLSESKKLIAAFPEVTTDFVILLTERLIDNQFTATRVRDAINHTIDTSPYRRPAIADIISWDRKVKLYTHQEVQSRCAPGYPAFEHFERIIFNGQPRWIER